MGYNTTITNEGAALLASVIANQGTITFTEMRFSDTDYTGSEATLTEGTFGGTFVTASAAASVVDSTTIKVAASFNNSGIVSAHPLYSIGVIGTDGNDTALIAVCTTSDPEATIRPPVPATSISTYAFNTNLTVSSTLNITVAGTTAAALYETDVVDNLISTATNKPLSANQGRVLKGNIDDNFSGQSNINFLINPFFTVNQRGQASYSSTEQYTVDLWKLIVANVTETVSSDGITLSHTNATERRTIAQYLGDFIKGKLVTASILLQDGTIYSVTNTFPTSIGSADYDFPNGGFRFAINNSNVAYFSILVNSGQTLAVRAVKLELGSVSTLENDVEPNYTTELLKCQRYYAPAGYCVVSRNSVGRYVGIVKLPVPMRSTPTIPTPTLTDALWAPGIGKFTPDTVSTSIEDSQNSVISFVFTGTALTENSYVYSKRVFVSADL